MRVEFNHQLKLLAEEHGVKQRLLNKNNYKQTTTEQEREVAMQLIELCKDKPVRLITMKWINNE